MSAAVNDRPPLSRPHLPLTGELHPLRREFERLLATGNVIALTFAMLACSILYFWPRAAVIDLDSIDMTPDEGVIVFSPPPIAPTGRNDVRFEAPTIIKGPVEYDPVPDEKLAEELDESAGRGGGADGEGEAGGAGLHNGWMPGDSIAIPEPPAPPNDHDYWDEAPVLLSCEPPVYPAIVREAGIDGTVMVRVFIGVSGKVKNAYVMDGPSVLHDSALESARTARFKAALAKGHPVEVWVVIPITFRLHGR